MPDIRKFATRTHGHASNALTCPAVFYIVEEMRARRRELDEDGLDDDWDDEVDDELAGEADDDWDESWEKRFHSAAEEEHDEDFGLE